MTAMPESGKKGTIHAMILAVGILLVGAIALAAGFSQTARLVSADVAEITEKVTINIYNELLLISTAEQGVKYYDTRKNFIIKLDSTHLKLTYKDKTGTLADNLAEEYTYSMRHHLKNVEETTIDDPYMDRLCISKRIVDCKPVITICLETEECCNIQPNHCKLVK